MNDNKYFFMRVRKGSHLFKTFIPLSSTKATSALCKQGQMTCTI